MRVLIDVTRSESGGWDVKIEAPGAGEVAFPIRSMAYRPRSPYVAPDNAYVSTAADPRLASDEGADELHELAKSVIGRRATKEQVVSYGRHLFDSLVGTDTWERLITLCDRSSVLELALRMHDEELHAPLWEALHDGTRFLSAHNRIAVAVTRVIPGAAAQPPKTVAMAPRVLFAIGGKLSDPTIRPGAEFVGLMRAVRTSGSPVTPFVLECASLRRITAAVASFGPDAVHMICHGQTVLGVPKLLLRPDEQAEGQDERPVDANELFASLAQPGATPPQLVVISACETAAPESPVEAAGGEHVTPFAVALVEAGVPIVVAMSGRVSDTACRLFTRRLGSMLAEGGELVQAAAHARRAAYLETDTPDTIDWLLPALFLANNVEHDYAPVDSSAGKVLRGRIDAYDLSHQPVFCGRQEFFEAYDNLVDPSHKLNVLVAWWEKAGVGKDRLLRELAARALADGRVPVLVMPPEKEPPRTPQQLGAQLGIAIESAREIHGLDPGTGSSLLRLAAGEFPELTPPYDRVQILSQLSKIFKWDDKLEAIGVAAAIREDLAALVDDVGTAGAIEPDAGAFVLLANVETWDRAREALFEEMLDPMGFGSQGHPVPVALTWRQGTPSGEQFQNVFDDSKRSLWMRFLQLAPLKDDDEILAYQWVLANAWPELNDEYARQAWVVKVREGEWREEYRNLIEGLPRKFESQIFWLLASKWAFKDEIVSGDDEAVLQRYLERQANG